jgi:hypothetical protein
LLGLDTAAFLSESPDFRRLAGEQDAAKIKGVDDVLEYCKQVKADAHSHSFEHWSLARRYISLKFKSFKKFHVRAVNDTRMAELEMMKNTSHFALMQFHLARAHERVSEMKKMVITSSTRTLNHKNSSPAALRSSIYHICLHSCASTTCLLSFSLFPSLTSTMQASKGTDWN